MQCCCVVEIQKKDAVVGIELLLFVVGDRNEPKSEQYICDKKYNNK
jgi:hypothetical protein